MNLHRLRLALPALLLLAVLFHGVHCGVEHFAAGPDAHAEMSDHEHQGAHANTLAHAPRHAAHVQASDCQFAATLPLALLAFAVLGWLLGIRLTKPLIAPTPRTRTPRFRLPRLNPQAP